MPFTYPQILNLDKFEVFHEDDTNNPKYFKSEKFKWASDANNRK